MNNAKWTWILVAWAAAMASPAVAARPSIGPRTRPDSVRIPSVPAPSYEDHVVVPGQRMGRLTLGMGAQDALAALGPPLMPQPAPWGGASEYRWPHVSVFLRNSDQKIIEIKLSDTDYRLDSGLTFDATRGDVVQKLGRPNLIWNDHGRQFYWYRSGLAMTFTNTDDTIDSLSVCADAGVCF